jgi:putative addiction module component (TIGR02574 family)
MGSPRRKVEGEALRLPPKARAQLAERLLGSLDDAFDPDNDRLWLEESERRLDELESGKVAGVPASKVFAHARSRRR